MQTLTKPQAKYLWDLMKGDLRRPSTVVGRRLRTYGLIEYGPEGDNRLTLLENDWSGERMTKDEAKKYVLEYPS